MRAAAAGVLVATGLVPFASASPPAAQAVTLPSGLQTGFQIDGNKTAAAPPGTFDWNDFLTPPQPDGSFTFTPTGPYTTASGAASSGVTQGAFYWDNGSVDAACSGAEATGQPGSQNPNTNPWVPGNAIPNDKGNICSGGYAVEAVTAPDGTRHTILYAYWTRRTDNSSVSVYDIFEGPRPGRCDDLLLEAVFPAGTTNFQSWTPAAGDDCANPLGPGTWGPDGRTMDFAFAMGQRTEGPDAPGQQANTFAEYAIDLTAAGLFVGTTCSTYTVSERFSRTGASPTATIHDFFLNTPEPLEISNCGTLTVTKQVTPPGTTQDEFGFTVSSEEGPIQLGPPPVQQIVDSVRPGETRTYRDVRSGTLTHLDEVTIPEPWLKQSVICSYRDFAGVTHTVDVTDPGTPFPILDDQHPTNCVITNNAALVTVTKQTDPDGAPDSFAFDFGGRTVELGDGESQTLAFPADAEVTISEDAREGWLAPDISCTSDPVATTERSVTVTAQLGRNIECTFTNTQLGTVIITKEAHGVDGRTFHFDGTFPGAEDGFDVLVERGDGTLYNTTFPNIPPGTYSITEFEDTADPPTVVSDVACTFGGADHSFPPESRTGTFTVRPGETVRCFFTNSLPQQIFVVKRTLPVEFDHQFGFTVDPPGTAPPFILNGNSDGPPAGALWSSPPLDPGQYTIREAAEPNWTLDDITCTADEDLWEPDLAAGHVTVDLPAGETVTCFFTNRAAPARVTVTKTVEGIAGTLPWAFDVAISPDTGLSPGPAQRLTGTGPGSADVTWNDLVPGQRYTISEDRQDGWQMGPLTCTDPANPGLTDLDDEPLTFTFVAGVGQQLACSMTNTGTAAQLRLTKITSSIGFDYPWQFDFTIGPVPPGEVAQKSVSGTGQTSDTIDWDNLVPGETYTVTELGELAGITANLSCTGSEFTPAAESFTFTAPLGGTVECTATNIVNPVPVEITKNARGGDGTFSFTLTPPPETGLDPERLEITTSGGTGTGAFPGLVPGQHYSLVEADDPAWEQSGLTCTVTPLEGDPFEIPDLADFTVDTGDSVACSATNTLVADSVSVTKTVQGVAEDFEWSFELSLTPESGGALTEVVSGTGNTSVPVSWSGMAPGTYALSEVLPDGWNPGTTVCLEGEQEVAPDALVIGGGRAYTCTVTNSPVPGRLTVTKSVHGVSEGFDWAFAVGIAPVPDGQPENATLTNTDPAHTWTTLTPGAVYTLTESVPAGWASEIQCGEGSRGDAAAGYEVLIEPGAVVECSIENTAVPGSGVITKSTVGGDGTFDFVLRPLPDGEPTTVSVRTEAGSGSTQLPELTPGVRYSLAEVAQPGWAEGELTCRATHPVGGSRDLDIGGFVVAPGEVLACEIQNRSAGTLTLTKSVTGVAGGFGWEFAFTLEADADPARERTVTGSGPGPGTVSWSGLVPGAMYTLREDVPAGWTAESLACAGVDDADPEAPGWQFTSELGQTIACTASNRADPATGMITKSTAGGDGSFEFDLRPLPAGEPTRITVATEGGDGSAALPSLVPGRTYALAETDLPGWTEGAPRCTARPAGGGTPRELDADGFATAPGDVLACSVRNQLGTTVPSAPGQLPLTGLDVAGILRIALALLVLGLAFLGVSRSKQP